MKRSAIFIFAVLGLAVCAAAQNAQNAFLLILKGDVPALKALLKKTPASLASKDDSGHTLLQLAAALDRREAAAVLIQMGASVAERDSYGRTPLLLCARERGTAGTARLLIEAGSDVNAVDKFGSSVLDLAAWRGKAEVVDVLLEKGAKVPESGEKWAGMLTQAVSKGLDRLFGRLTSGAGGLKAALEANPALLYEAAAGGSGKIVAALLNAGIAAGAADRFGWTPLHYAARDGRIEAARILIRRGAPLDARSLMGQTAYNVALERKMEPVARLLDEKGADKSAIRFPILKGDYLGQKPPGEKAELFGRGIISSVWGLHSVAVFSPDGNEVYWAPMIKLPGEIYSRGGLLMMKRVDGVWTPPAPVPLSGPAIRDDAPFFSADGKRLYFLSARPIPRDDEEKERIWFVDRTKTGWSEPRPLDPAVNNQPMHWSFSMDKKADLYFGGQGQDNRGMSDIYRARFVNGKFEKPVNMGDPISSKEEETTPFVAPDGSYLVFSRQFDIWVSFRQADATWGAPVKLGPEVNTSAIEVGPAVTADGKYLFFLSQRDGESWAYWVNASVIEKARPKR